MSISRRDVLKSLAVGAAATSVLRAIPAHAAEYAHHMVAAEKAATSVYAPKFFPAHEYKTLQTLCQTIIPARPPRSRPPRRARRHSSTYSPAETLSTSAS